VNDIATGVVGFARRHLSRIIEFGHYYMAHGPTALSLIGFKISEEIKEPGDKTLLFVDDIHDIGDVNEQERCLPPVEFDPQSDFRINESEVFDSAFAALEVLKGLPKKHRARFNGNGVKKWHCSGFSLTHENGDPTCMLIDVGLTVRKHGMGFGSAINVLPEFYEEQQKGVQRLVRKIIPDFHMEAILFSQNGNYRKIATM